MKKLILITVMLISFTSCVKEYKDLTDEEKKEALYYTYNLGDTVKFKKTATNDTLVYTVTKNELSYKRDLTQLIDKHYVQNVRIVMRNVKNVSDKIIIDRNKEPVNFDELYIIRFAKKTFYYLEQKKNILQIDSFIYNDCMIFITDSFYTHSTDTLYCNAEDGILIEKKDTIIHRLIK